MRHSTVGVIVLLIFKLDWKIVAQATSCQLQIMPDSIAGSWQSSSFTISSREKLCFFGSSGSNSPESNSYKYFHTAVSTSDVDDGWHWFVVKLKEATLISSVSIKVRDVTLFNEDTKTQLKSRSADIEIKVSKSNNISLGTEHCGARGLNSLLNPGWELCGRTPSLSGIVSDQVVTVNCGFSLQAQYLLLRKKADSDNLCMSFNNMWIQKAEVKAELLVDSVVTTSHTVFQGSRVTVRCTRVCENNQITICPPKDGCQNRYDLQIDQVKPWNSGNYTCNIGSRSVSSLFLEVNYPPSELSITPTGPVTCGQLSTSSSQPAFFQVESSVADPPPKHECTARDPTSGEPLMMQLSTPESTVLPGKPVRSYWKCDSCSNAPRLNIFCTAKQANGVEKSKFWTCEPASSLNIIFDKTDVTMSQKMEVNFKLVSYAASPEPQHKCHANASEGINVEGLAHWSEKRSKGDKGVVRSHWTATVSKKSPWQQNDHLKVTCSASSPNAWFREATDVWPNSNHHPLPSIASLPAWSVIMLVAGVLFLFAVAAISSCACVKMSRLSVKPGDIIRASAVGTRQAIQYLSDVNQTNNGMYDNPETEIKCEDVYDCVLKIEESNFT